MIGGKGGEARRQRRAMQVGELVRMQFHPQPVRVGRVKNLRDFLRRKSNALAKPIDRIRQFLRRDLRNQSLADQPYISRAVGQKLRRQRMRAQKCRGNINRAVLPNLADHAQQFQLRCPRKARSRI